MVHSVLIVLHAGFAVAGFVLGWLVLARLPERSSSRRFVWFFWCMVTAMVLLIAVVAADWVSLDVTKRIAFGVLCGLAVYILVRLEQARRVLAHGPEGWRKKFIGHVGFVMISLFDGFCIVTAIDLRMPAVVIVAVAVIGVVVGIVAIRRLVRRDEAGRARPEVS
jgi:hypothetical protein